MHDLDDRAAGGAFCIFHCVESHAMECHAIDRLLIPGPICHEIKPLDLSCNGIQRTHSSKPFLALGCQCCQHHHTAFLALDLQLSSFLSWRTRTCRSVAPLLSSDNVLLVT